MINNSLLRLAGTILISVALAACGRKTDDLVQGYVEGEFVYVSSPLAGTLQNLAVQRGDKVTANQLLFALDDTMEKAARDQARAELVLSEAQFARQQDLFRAGPASAQDFDQARSARDQDKQRLAQAEWNLEQMKQDAPKAGLVFDTLYREGEFVPAGKPVVMLLPPGNIKVRAFVSQTEVGNLQVGQEARVMVDGVTEPFVGKIRYISTRAEFTPPVIYSRESREKLVFLIEIRFEPEVAARLHPGQPVDVQLKAR